jgi:hypothetical protein
MTKIKGKTSEERKIRLDLHMTQVLELSVKEFKTTTFKMWMVLMEK